MSHEFLHSTITSSLGWISFFDPIIAFMHAERVMLFVHLMKYESISLQSGLTLSSEGILGPLGSDLPAEGLDLSEVASAEDS